MGDLNAALVPQNLRGTEAATFAQLSQILRYPRICGALRRRGAIPLLVLDDLYGGTDL